MRVEQDLKPAFAIEIRDSAGNMLATTSSTGPSVPIYPNGRGCRPTCFRADLRLDPKSGKLVAA